MLRLKRHIVTEILEVFFAVIIALILIMVSFQFAKLLGEAANGKIVGSAIYKLVALHAVNLFVLLTPFAFFIAALIGLSRLATDNELIAMKSVGHSDWDTYQSLLILAMPLAGFLLYLTLSVLPQTLSLAYDLTQKAKKESELSVIQPGHFRTIGGKTTIFVADVDDKTFSKFFVWQKTIKNESITVATNGMQTEKEGERYIELNKGSRFTETPNNAMIMAFENLIALMPTVRAKNRKEKIKGQNTQRLLDNPTIENQVEIQRRVSPAISILMLALFAPLLVQFNPRENRYGKFVIAIFTYLIYANSQFILQALIEDKKLAIYPGIYLSHLLFFSLILMWVAWRSKRAV